MRVPTAASTPSPSAARRAVARSRAGPRSATAAASACSSTSRSIAPASSSASGAAGGILVTLLLVNVFAPARPATAAPAEAAAGGTGGTGTAATLDIPTAAAAALRGTTAINARLAAEAEPLAAALDAKRLNTSAVQKVLRRMSIDTRAGAGMVKTFTGWPEAAGQQAALAAFYEELGGQIDKGLGASLKSTGRLPEGREDDPRHARRDPGDRRVGAGPGRQGQSRAHPGHVPRRAAVARSGRDGRYLASAYPVSST